LQRVLVDYPDLSDQKSVRVGRMPDSAPISARNSLR